MQEELSDYSWQESSVPGMNEMSDKVTRFHCCLGEMMEKFRDERDDEMYAVRVLEALADGCNRMGLSQEFSVRMASFVNLFQDIHYDTLKEVFKTAYLKEYIEKIPLGYMRKSALLTFRTEAYMKEHYLLRLNVMTGVPEYKQLGGLYSFAELDKKARNTMSINALKAGVDSWDKDLNRYIDSTLIPQYEPLTDYLTHLPKWDKKDRIGALASRVKTDNKYWEKDFHKWMLSMVAQWLGNDAQHGNSIVPLLIGPQGSGKTTFCRRLLPKDLQRYFNDRISMKNDNDIFIAMSSLALINIDEFDALSKRQQPILKYLLTKHDVKMRPPYGKVMEQRRRYASFIATTNNLRPLVDPTGSRRFLCVYADEIDNSGKLNYAQIYAQLYYELMNLKPRYWFNETDNKRIMRQNARFQQVSDYETMVSLTYMPAEETPEDAPLMRLSDIIHTLAKKFPAFTITNTANRDLGRVLRSMGYEVKRTSKGISYRLMSISSEEK